MKKRWSLLIILQLIFINFIYSIQSDSLDQLNASQTLKDSLIHRAFDKNFKEKYNTSDFDYKEKEKNAFERWLNDQNKRNNISNPSPIWPLIFKLIIIVVLIYTVFVIIGILMGKKGNWLFNKDNLVKNLYYGAEEDEIKSTDFLSLIKESKTRGDFRMAVRYHYLYTLQNLSQKGLVAFHKEKTNTDYRYEIKNLNVNEAFTYVSYIYDCTWYGEFLMSEGEYRLAEIAFDETNKLI